jgi:hypothetical protein
MIDKALRVCKTKTKIAERLDASLQRLLEYERGGRAMPDEKIVELAKIAGEDQVKALGEYHFEWLRKKKAAAHVNGVVWAFLIAAGGIAGSFDEAHASTANATQSQYHVTETSYLLSAMCKKAIGRAWKAIQKLASRGSKWFCLRPVGCALGAGIASG